MCWAARSAAPSGWRPTTWAPNGTLTERGRLEPGGRATLDFGRSAAALVRNLGERQAKLDFKISGDVSFGMGMGYEGLRK